MATHGTTPATHPKPNGSQPPLPGFVYGILVSLRLFFNVFALNQWLQYRAKGNGPGCLFGQGLVV